MIGIYGTPFVSLFNVCKLHPCQYFLTIYFTMNIMKQMERHEVLAILC